MKGNKVPWGGLCSARPCCAASYYVPACPGLRWRCLRPGRPDGHPWQTYVSKCGKGWDTAWQDRPAKDAEVGGGSGDQPQSLVEGRTGRAGGLIRGRGKGQCGWVRPETRRARQASPEVLRGVLTGVWTIQGRWPEGGRLGVSTAVWGPGRRNSAGHPPTPLPPAPLQSGCSPGSLRSETRGLRKLQS